MATPLDPIILSAGTGVSVPLKQTSAANALLIANKSQFDLQLTGFGGYGSRWLASGVEDLLIDRGENSGQLSINVFNTANLQNPPNGACLITVYLKDEPLPLGKWPVSIPSQVVNSTSNTTTNLVNDGNPTSTQFIEVTVSGAPESSYIFKTDGTISIGELIANVVTLFIQSFPGQTVILKLGESAKTVEILGSLTVDSDLTMTSGSMRGTSTNDVKLDANTGKKVFLKNNGVNIVGIDGANVTLQGSFGFDIGVAGVYRFRNGGTMQAISNFTGSGSGTYNHGFGSAPFMVIPIVDVAGSATQGYDTITSTQVHITLGAVLGFRAFCWS